jgi:hypothetical protein
MRLPGLLGGCRAFPASLRNGTLRAKRDEQVPKRRAAIGQVAPHPSSTCTARQVVVKEDGDRDFVDPVQRQPPGTYPAREMRYLTDVAGNSVRGVPAFGQVTPERDGVRSDGIGIEPIDLDDTGVLSSIHGDLQMWITSARQSRNHVQFGERPFRLTLMPRRCCLHAISAESAVHSWTCV